MKVHVAVPFVEFASFVSYLTMSFIMCLVICEAPLVFFGVKLIVFF